MRVIAHVSETHFGNDVQDPVDRATAVMEHLVAMSPRPDMLVVTGDLADHGLPEEYAIVRRWLDLWPGPLGREWADRQRVSRIEAVVLNDQGRLRLVRIDAAGDGDDVSASHTLQSSETASTKSMSLHAPSAAATSWDWR